MDAMEWWVAAVVVIVLIGWYLSYSAARLDRLHARVEGSLNALDAQLVRRAEATLELVTTGELDPASSLMLAGAAGEALDAGDEDASRREVAESDLTRALDLALSPVAVEHLRGEGLAADVLDRVAAANRKVQLARRFHNDAVTQVRRVRGKQVVRVFRLAGHAEMPRTFEIDDELPTLERDH